jgi:hypothetical protein
MGLFDFDQFALKDIWGQIKKDPERLFMGAIDPISTKMWNGITGKKYEPLVDQMGGPYGGHTVSAFGANDGGVYKRAEEAGIDTKKGSQMHDAAHVVSAIFGAQGLMGAGSNLMGAGAQGGAAGSNLGVFANGGQAGMGSVGAGNAGALAQSGSLGGGAGLGTATQSAPMGWKQYAQMAQQMQPRQQQPQQQQPKPYWVNGRIVWL